MMENYRVTGSWKTWLWRTLITAAVLIVIAAGFYAEENSRGLKAWTDCKRQLEARGENLDWTNYIPAPVPDDQNFFKAPMMTEWFVRDTTNRGLSLTAILGNPETTSDVITEISASNYLAWSAAIEPDLDKIRAALQRPDARLNGDYGQAFQQPFPNFVNYRIVTQVLAHRAKCELLLGEPEPALADLTLLSDLNETLVIDEKPLTLVASMIHVAITGLYADAVACGIESHSWREPELATLQRRLAQIRLLPEVAFSLRAGSAGTCHLLATTSTDQFMRVAPGSSITPSELGWWLMPSGWIYQNMAVVATLEHKPVDCLDLTNDTVSPYKAEAANLSTQQALQHSTPYNFFAAICVPSFKKAVESTARNQTWLDQAQIACALERYRLANGNYPATLAALVPKFIAKLPHDIIGGKPLIYSCKDGQDFLLYSIGWNETDDGGITAHNSDGREDIENGDWVWRYPAQ